MARAASCELSALLEVVRLVEEEGVPLVTLQRGDHPCQHHDLPYINLNQDLHPPVLAPLEQLPPPPQPAVSQQCSSSSTSSRLLQGGPCHSCGVTEAPQWRRPDQGSMLLCNRCGIHYMRHRKLPGPKKEASSSGSQAARLGFGAAAAQQAMKRTASELWELGPCWSTVSTEGLEGGGRALQQQLLNRLNTISSTTTPGFPVAVLATSTTTTTTTITVTKCGH